MPITVYSSTDGSAPQLTGSTDTTTDVAAILEACLVTGYGSKPGQGWTKPYASGTTTVFRQPVDTSNGFYLRLDASTTGASVTGYDVKFRGYESMTSATEGTGPFPTVAQMADGVWMMRLYSSGTAAAWMLITNGKMVYFFVRSAVDSSYGSVFAFGDINPSRTGDAYNTIIIGNRQSRQTNYNSIAYGRFHRTVNIASADSANYMARSHTQLGSSAAVGKHSDYIKGGSVVVWGMGGLTYPNPSSHQLIFTPAWVHEVNTLRGTLPGVWALCHNSPFTDGDVITGTGAFANRQFMALRAAAEGASANAYDRGEFLIELTGDWS